MLKHQGTATNEVEITDDKDESGGEDNLPHEPTQYKKQKKSNTVPTLERLWHNLEMANSHPNNALQYLKQLYEDAEKISIAQNDNQKSGKTFNFSSSSESEIQETIESFMQNAQLLVDSHFELRSVILSILSKLTIIESNSFGVLCFNTLKDLMVGGPELEDAVMEQLEKEVICKLKYRDIQLIPVSLLIGLKDLVEKSHQTQLLADLYEKCFLDWLRDLRDEITERKKKNIEDSSTGGHYDAVVALLAASVNGNSGNVKKLIDMGIHLIIAEIFVKSLPTSEVYRHLLDCMNSIAILSDHAASKFIEKYVHKELLSEIKVTYYNYKKHNDLVPASGQEDDDKLVKRYKIFSGQIELLASLLNAKEQETKAILTENLVFDLLIVISHFKTDPLLLTAVCHLAEMILSRDIVKKDAKIMGKAVRNMGNCVHLIPYLGQSKYEELLRQTRKYNKNETFVDPKNKNNLQIQDDPIIHTLFISIINLINFFCKELAKYKRQTIEDLEKNQRECMKKCNEVCKQMNEQGRDAALIDCLDVQNDEVRISVVNCLFNVPLNELDVEEIGKLLRIMEAQNIGAGKTEIVLSTIFWILTKMLKDTESDASRNFKSKFSIQAINEGVKLLKLNQDRQVEDEEEEMEKYTLSLSILNFFKFASEVKETKVHLKRKGDDLKQILYAEQTMVLSEKYRKIPIEIEDTQLGLSFESLRNAITNQRSVDPYNYVSFRILHRMANLLQFERVIQKCDPYAAGEDTLSERTLVQDTPWKLLKDTMMKQNHETDEIYKQLNEDQKVLIQSLRKAQMQQGDMAALEQTEYSIPDKLMMHYGFVLTSKISKERDYWPDFDEERMNKVKANSPQDTKEYEEHHEIFTRNNGVNNLLMFLSKKQTEDDNWLRKNADPQIEHAGKKEKLGLRAQIKSEKKRLKKQLSNARGQRNEEDDQFGAVQAGGVDIYKQNKTTAEQMTECFQNEQLGSGFEHDQAELYMLQHQQQTLEAQRLNKRNQMHMGIESLEMRSLCIAAFLRCLHASLEYAPDEEIYQEAIKNLQQDDIFKSITQLCASTGWFEANIGTKYLQVMRYIIRLDYAVRQEEKENLMKYEVLATVIQRILSILSAKIKNENDNKKLEVDDKKLLSQLAMICNEMCSQCNLFPWSTSRKLIDDGIGEKCAVGGNLIRSTQQKLIDFMLVKLFPINIVEVMLQIIFQDMQGANRLYDDDPDSENKDAQIMMEADRKSREHIKMFLSEYLANCETNKYEVLSYLMRNIVFVGKSMRTSFLEEILQDSYQAAIRDSYGKFIHRNKLSIAFLISNDILAREKRGKENAPENLKEAQESKEKGERIIYCVPMFVAFAMQKEYKTRTVMLTNMGIYILRDPDNNTGAIGSRNKPCSDCPPEQLCQKGPQILAKFNYMQIPEIRYFSQKAQKIVLFIQQPQNYMEEPQQQSPQKSTTAGEDQEEEVKNMTQGRNKSKKEKKIAYYLQLVYPNVLSFLLLQRALHTLVECQYPEGSDLRKEDNLLEEAIKYKLEIGPKGQLEIVRYVADLDDCDVSEQKSGNGNKGFSSKQFSSDRIHEKLAILVVTKDQIALFKEKPEFWVRAGTNEARQQHEILSRKKEIKRKDRQNQEIKDKKNVQEALQSLIGEKEIWKHKLEQLKSMNVLTGKIPGVQFEFKNEKGCHHTVSFLSDFNGQVILEQIKILKQKEGADDSLDSDEDSN